MSKKVGITGGIGSGKTTVCRIFGILGIPVYFADERAKKLMTEDEELRGHISSIFGNEAYLPDGSLNRKHLSAIAFSNKEKLKELESVVHPAVARNGDNWHKMQINAPYTLKEAALLVENGSYKHFDKMILVTAPQAVRTERVMARDGISKEAVEARMNAQLPEEEKRKVCDYIIENDGKTSLIQQVLAVHRELLKV